MRNYLNSNVFEIFKKIKIKKKINNVVFEQKKKKQFEFLQTII